MVKFFPQKTAGWLTGQTNAADNIGSHAAHMEQKQYTWNKSDH